MNIKNPREHPEVHPYNNRSYYYIIFSSLTDSGNILI